MVALVAIIRAEKENTYLDCVFISFQYEFLAFPRIEEGKLRQFTIMWPIHFLKKSYWI